MIQRTLLTTEGIAAGLERVRRSGEGWMACCPAHDDHNPSLSITDREGDGVLVHCHAGCEQTAVINALRGRGLWDRDFVSSPYRNENGASETIYPYQCQSGAPAFEIVRRDGPGGKTIRPRLPDGSCKAHPKPRPLYHLPELLDDSPVTVYEGEKCVDAALKAWPDRIATTWAGGANADSTADWSPLYGRDVLLVADADDPGRTCMERIAVRLHANGSAVQLALPEGTDGADVSDWIAQSGAEAAMAKIETLARAYEPPVTENEREQKPERQSQPTENEAAGEFANVYRPLFAYRPRRGWYVCLPSGQWREDGDDTAIRKRLRADCVLRGIKRVSSVRGILWELESELTIKNWTEHSGVAGLPSGKVVDLRTAAVRSVADGERISRRLGCDPDFDKPDLWLRTLAETLPDDYLDWFQRFVGYCLTGYTREHVFLFAVGGGRNGKSTVLGIVQKLLGEYWRGLPQTALVGGHYEQHPEWLARIEGARLVSALELPESGSWRLPLLKALVAGDPMTARHMRMGSFDFTPQCKLIVAGNHKPNLGTVDKAFESRLVLLPFERTFEGDEVDRELPDKLHAELPRILGWAIEGACKYFIEGLGDKPGSATTAAADYIAEQDRFGAWAEARLTFEPEAFTASRALLADYNEFAGPHLTQPTPIVEYLSQREGIEPKQRRVSDSKNAVRGLLGVTIRK